MIYGERMYHDPLAFMKDAIDWNAFSPLLEDLYRKNAGKGGAPNIPIVIMMKVLFLQSIFTKMKQLRGKFMTAYHS